MKPLRTLVVLAVLSASFALALEAADRLNDKQVKATIENIDRGFDKWKQALEKQNMDDAVIRSASGTIDVKKFLKDFEGEIEMVRDRMKPGYAANPEVTALLRRASDVERRAQQPGSNPSAEWKELSAQLASLASAYGTSLPLPTADAVAMRLSDKEVADRLEQLEQQSKSVADAAEKIMKQAKASGTERDKVKQSFARLAASAKQTRSMVNSGSVTGAQVEALVAAARAATGAAAGLGLSGPGGTALASLEANVAAIARAFGVDRA